MTAPWADDERLFEDLRAAVHAAGQVPPDVITAAKAAFELRTLDEELARLTYDSRADAELVGAFRSDKLSVRSLVFGFADITLDVDVLPDSFVGQISPPLPGRLVVETRAGVAGQGEIDELGMFSVPVCLPGEVRFRVEPHDRPSFTTEWTRI